ncbi:MAG: transcriptional regulator, partial [Halomonas sp.]|nr:transcriptional regulator [Halomonas sp.]
MSQEIDILSRITADVASLRDAEKKVAELIFADIDFVTEASISEIAARAGVSDASVTRFARAVGCNNV